MWINKGSLLGILNSSYYSKPQQYHGSLKEKIPAHMIIPRKLKREDTGTYDNTTEASDNTTTYFHIMDYNDFCCLLLLPVFISWIAAVYYNLFPYNGLQGLLLYTTTSYH